jgi:hypothetical protein
VGTQVGGQRRVGLPDAFDGVADARGDGLARLLGLVAEPTWPLTQAGRGGGTGAFDPAPVSTTTLIDQAPRWIPSLYGVG